MTEWEQNQPKDQPKEPSIQKEDCDLELENSFEMTPRGRKESMRRRKWQENLRGYVWKNWKVGVRNKTRIMTLW